MSFSRARTTLLVPLFLVSASTPLLAWPAEIYRNMVLDTLRLLPPALGRVLARNEKALIQGAYSLEGETASALARDGLKNRLSAELVDDVEIRIRRVVEMVNDHRPFRETALEFGRILRIAADLSDPTIVGAGSAELRRVSSEYHRFVDLHTSELPLVHDKKLPSPLGGASVRSLLYELRAETGAVVRPLSEAFWRDGRLVPATEFDFRSYPYAATSLNYSRGVTAASYLWLAAWAEANGDFTGYRFQKKAKDGSP